MSAKTYNRGDSRALTDRNTNLPVHCLYMAERTGSLVLSVLWSYVNEDFNTIVYIRERLLPHTYISISSFSQSWLCYGIEVRSI
jgi:hypothetical protein